MAGRARHRPPHFKARDGPGNAICQSNITGEHPGDAVDPALLPFADIVQKAGDDQIVVGVTAFQQPTGSGSAVDDIAWVLSTKEREQFTAKVAAGEFEIGTRWEDGCLAELAKAPPH